VDKVFFIAAIIAMAGVLASLLLGLFAMAKGGEKDHKTSNKMMRARVMLQGLTIFLLLLAFLAKK
jgi:hypothetical protein